MVREFVNNLYNPSGSWLVQDPFYKVRIDSMDNNDIVHDVISSWSYDNIRENYSGVWYGASRSGAAANINFTKTFTFPKTGLYMIEIFCWKRPSVADGNKMIVSVAGNTILEENMHNDWEDYGTWVRTPIFNGTQGSNSININLPKHACIAFVRVIPITRYEGGKGIVGNSENRLDLIGIEFTANGVTEVDDCTIKVAFKEDYFTDDNPYSRMAFDAWDHVTVWIGEDMQSTLPMFGGYVSGWELSDDMTELSIKVVDRLYDLSRVFLWKNFSIGYIPDTTDGTMPYTQFANVNEIARYLCTSDHPLDFSAITKDYVFYNNFKSASDVTEMPIQGWLYDWQAGFGNPGPCMRLRPGTGNNQTCSLTVYSSTLGEWNAKDYNMFAFDYYASGAGIKLPVKFNVEIDMYKTAENPDSYETYTIGFSGPSVKQNSIGTVLPTYDGNWQTFKADLKSMFNTKTGSGDYFIRAVRLVGLPDESVIINNKCSSIYIDHIIGYKTIQNAPKYASADTPTPLAELQDLCTTCNQVAYVRYADERKDDQLLMFPMRYYTLGISIEEGQNLLGVSQLQYHPIDWGLKNYQYMTFTYNNNTSGSITKQDEESIRFYGTCMEKETNSDVTSLTDAESVSQNFIDEHSFWYPSFEVVVKGSAIFEPGQYVNVSIPSKRLFGAHEVKSLSYKLDCVNGYYTTSIAFNQPHRMFMNFLRQTKKSLKQMKNLQNNTQYKSFGNQEGALNTSTGGMIRS